MKAIILLTFCVFGIFAFACAGSNSSDNLSNNSQTSEKQIYKAVGVVKKVDAKNGKITIDHEEIKGYMSAMEEMDFAVRNKSLLATSKVGDKVDFEIERTGEKLVITELNKIGEVTIFVGAEIYKTNCASCHGDIGEGTNKGISLVKGHALHHSENEHIKQVTDGEGKKMPAFKDKLSSEQIAAVVKFVRTEIQKGANRENSNKHSH